MDQLSYIFANSKLSRSLRFVRAGGFYQFFFSQGDRKSAMLSIRSILKLCLSNVFLGFETFCADLIARDVTSRTSRARPGILWVLFTSDFSIRLDLS
jgi:hypothetical protein